MELPAVRFKTAEHNAKHFVTIEVLDEQWAALEWELATFKAGQACVKFSKPHKPRSTGPRSQNSHAWGHCTQIARELGMEVYEVEYIAKVRAIKRGYPVSTQLGMMIPKSQADIDTVECGYLIEEYHQIAAENGIVLTETEPEILAKPEGFYRDTNTLKPDPIVRVKAWHEMTREEQREADPARFDEEMQLEIF
jgi:hypothetical protein